MSNESMLNTQTQTHTQAYFWHSLPLFGAKVLNLTTDDDWCLRTRRPFYLLPAAGGCKSTLFLRPQHACPLSDC